MEKKRKVFGMMSYTQVKKVYDHKLLKIQTFEPLQNFELSQKLKKYIDNISHFKDRLIRNYIKIDFSSQLAISLFLQNEQIRGFSSVAKRNFYPENTVRIFNRHWEDPKIRKISKVIGGKHLIISCNQQLEIAKKNGFNRFFISRDKNPKYMNELTKVLNKKTKLKWFFHTKKLPVCNPSSEDCWQWVIFSNLKECDNKTWVEQIYEYI